MQNLETEISFKIIEKLLHVLTKHIQAESKDLDWTDGILDTIHNIA